MFVAGDWQHEDFADFRDSIPRGAIFLAADQWETPSAGGRSIPPPELLVLAQSRRYQFSPARVAGLRQAFDAATPVHLLSSQGEGEMRSGRPLIGWNRVYWYHWPAEFAAYRAARDRGEPAVWGGDAPLTARQRLERVVASIRGGRCQSVGVASRFRTSAETIAAALASLGHQVQSFAEADVSGRSLPRGIESFWIDSNSLDEWTERMVRRLKRIRRVERIVVTLNFPRRYEVNALRLQAGRRLVVMGKPWDLFEAQQALV
jgi:hypothetical protein